MIKLIPKFRAWDPHEKKMVDDTELVIWGGNIYQGNRQKIFERIVEGKKGLIGYSIDDKYLMQSTGLKDKNGTEIFEGDVVRLLDSLYTVFYDSEKGSYRLKPHDDRWVTDYMSNFSHGGNFEVVGNICEGKEYL
ncbi:YopX family protein [Streptococcus anginosus]|uniref:YopX family protein n=1 Tax=Streptococcus anginosus TaxID=1328 RepID=UPI0021F86773|nr:YopX family protein [Streptococcus anginosus]MED5959619.1 YopX family protein [Streptococcus anginosus]MED5973741.1 YopX family protein [Streptococcus anginosus]